MDLSSLQPIEAAVTLAVIWIGLGVLGLACMRVPRLITGIVFPAGALVSLALAVTGLWAIGVPPSSAILPAGLPDLPFHVRLDALSGFFLLLLGGVSFGVALFAAGYFRDTAAATLGQLTLQYHLFLASMAFVLIADDAYLFMITWESMALSSYFLVTTEHHDEQNRKAGFIYLLIAHIGALGILLCFGVLHGGHGDYTFEALRAADLNGYWATVAFLLAFFGFGAKAGMLPLHVWLPEAHPAAPSPVSALMSGVMLKTAIYGMVRVIFDLIGGIRWEWGLTVLLFGAATSLFGVLFALMQHDLKRLLAYHSVENIGIILIGIGLAMVFIGSGHPVAGALALIAGLYHTLNHAVFKGLLFLGAGAILKSTGLRNLNEMGGLIRYMPHTALYFLIGALAISALPPLNGFVSEWLTFQASLQAPQLASSVVRSLVPIVAAVLALSGALTGMCFVKVYGIAFLGQHRH
ncbi:MAG: proton-conducting transporter membrane subunit, partial [Pseudomonadota bacterium]